MQETTCNAGDAGSISGLGRSCGEGNSNPLQYSCLKSHGQRSLVATAHGVAGAGLDLGAKPPSLPPCLPSFLKLIFVLFFVNPHLCIL